jgi:adenine-specific DNA-methyltransferase
VIAAEGEDGIRRHYIMVQLPEPADEFGATHLASLLRRRVTSAAEALQASPKLAARSEPFGFRAFRLQSSNFRPWDASAATADAVSKQLALAVEHVVDGSTEQAMLLELLLKAGYPLTSPVAEVDFAGVPGYSVAEGALLICLSRQLSIKAFEAMVELEPAMILVLDAGFGGSDELKVNALQTVRARNLQSGSDIALRVV